MNNIYFSNEEKAIFALRALYEKYGYSQYKMCKFEEYDLYLKNKDFLISDNIITFTDTDGRLMALKPDVTLSIIKNLPDFSGSVQKVYYSENVYRASKSNSTFKEIMQSGLECIGAIDDYTIYEVLMLAAESLNTISNDYVIDISHLGIVSAVIDSTACSDDVKNQILKCIDEKNLSALCNIEKNENIDLTNVKELISTYGSLDKIMPFLESMDCKKEVSQLIKILSALEKNGYKDKIRIDFSVISDIKYYNGFVFKGFINGIPASVLSGGQYDRLMARMKNDKEAIGFAVYLDMLELLQDNSNTYDVDTVILYDENTGIDKINKAIAHFTENGDTVTLQRTLPDKLRYRNAVKITEGGEILENA